MNNRFHDVWRRRVEEQLTSQSGFPGILAQVKDDGGRFSTWDQLRRPADAVEVDLDYAINIGCAFPAHAYYATFLAWANEAADRALGDPRFDINPEEIPRMGGWRIDGVFPGNHGKTLAAACFARALRDNGELDTGSMAQAIDEIAVSALDGGSKAWDCIAQSEYLRCVRLALVAGDGARAQHLLRATRRKFKHTFVHQEWLQAFVNAVDAAAGSALSAPAAAHFQEFFDQARHPDAKLSSNQHGGTNLFANVSILRLELATIKQRYILRQPLAGNWPAILALISE